MREFPVDSAGDQPETETPEALAATFDRFARFYDADYREYDADLQLILDLAEESGDPVLELGCGTGRALLPLALAGHQVTGVDISPALLDVARRKLQRDGIPGRVALVEDDMRTVALPENHFAFAFCVSNTFMHCNTQADQIQALRNVHRSLQPGGLLLLDLFNPDLLRLAAVDGLCELADQWQDEAQGARVLKWSVRRLDMAEQLQETTFIYEELLADGHIRRTPCTFFLRFLWRGEGELMLTHTGFEVEAVWGDFDGAPYSSEADHLILLASKVSAP
jgi:SAM-dependent methyltransferase